MSTAVLSWCKNSLTASCGFLAIHWYLLARIAELRAHFLGASVRRLRAHLSRTQTSRCVSVRDRLHDDGVDVEQRSAVKLCDLQ